MAGWKDWVDGSFGHSLRGTTYGALLGWLYDSIRDKKKSGKGSVRRIATGALIGSLAGAAFNQHMSNGGGR